MDTPTSEVRCPEGVAPEDVVAFTLDGEVSDHPDLAAHLAGCLACAAVGRSVARAAEVSSTLRGQAPTAPAGLGDRTVDRVRLEASVLLLARTVFAAFGRTLRALPDLFGGPRGDGPEDGSAGGSG